MKFFLTYLWIIGSLSSLMANHDCPIEGRTCKYEITTVSTMELLGSIQKSAAIKKGKKEVFVQSFIKKPKCPAPPSLSKTGVPVPQNEKALPIAFFPFDSISNSKEPPPQKIGLKIIAGEQGKNPSFIGTPPDTCLAVGKSQVIMGDNQGFVVFDKKTGHREDVGDAEITSIMNLDGNFTEFLQAGDVRIRYDHFSERYFLITLTYDFRGNLTNNGVCLAISEGSVITPFSQWTKVLNINNLTVIRDPQGCPGDQNTIHDFPSMAIDKHAVYIGWNIFDAKQNFLTLTLNVIQKESLFKGPAVITAFRDIIGFPGDSYPIRNAQGTLQPAMNFDCDDQKYGYLISTDPAMFGSLLFWRIEHPGSEKPRLSEVIPIDVLTTGSFVNPSPVTFPDNYYGNFGAIEYVDDRLQMAHVINRQLYTAHAILTDKNGIGSQDGDRVSSRWYQFDLTGDCTGCGKGCEKIHTKPALVQAGTLFDADNEEDPLAYNFPAIMTNKKGDLTLCGTVSSKKYPLSAFFVGRTEMDEQGTLLIGKNPPSVFYKGSGPFTRSLSSNTQRWGDFSYTQLDHEDGLTMWTIQEVAENGVEVQVVAELKAPKNRNQ